MKGRLMRTSLICAATVTVVAGVVACSDGSSGLNGAAGGSSGSGNISSTAGTPPSGAGTSSDPSAGTGQGGGSAGTSATAGGTPATTGGGSTGGSTTGGSTTGGSTTGGAGGTGGATTGDGLKHGAFKMLVLSTTLDFHHDSIPTCNVMLNDLGMAAAPERATISGLAADTTWTVDQINPDPKATNYFSEVTAENFAKYDMIYSNNPTGPVFTNAPDGANKKIVFQNYMDNGGGWAGQHSATDFENNNRWSWFDDHVAGGWFVDHNGETTPGTIVWQPAFAAHPILKGLASPWNAQDEWYIMNRDIEAVPGFKILAKVTTVGTDKYPAATQRPAVWITENAKGGRTFYTIRGHADKVYAEPEFRQLMLRGILWSVHRLPGGN
jgi:type 1 glutamine amidotransferase